MANLPPRKHIGRLRNVHFHNIKTGVSLGPGHSLDAENVSFSTVEQPWAIDPDSDLSVRGSRISDDPKLRLGREAGARIGWRRMDGPPLPVFCSECKSIFPSANYIYAGAYFSSWDNEEPCPNCGNEHAKLSEGIFDLTGEVARIISAPDFTHEMFAQVLSIADAVKAGTITLEDAIAETEKVSGALVEVWRKALAWGRPALLVLLGALPGWGSLYYDATSSTDEQLVSLNASSKRQEQVLEQILQRLPEVKPNPAAAEHKAVNGYGRINPQYPATSKTPTETSSIHRTTKPKSRTLKRRQLEERRRLMRGG